MDVEVEYWGPISCSCLSPRLTLNILCPPPGGIPFKAGKLLFRRQNIIFARSVGFCSMQRPSDFRFHLPPTFYPLLIVYVVGFRRP